MRTDRSLFRIALDAVVTLAVVAWVVAWASAGCGGRDEPARFKEDTIDLRPIAWSTQAAGLGKVVAVADSVDDVAVFGRSGASLWSDGIQVTSDESVTSWRTAAAVPAPDLPESWLLGVDQLGRIRRMHSRRLLEDVSERFGLAGRPVLEVAALGANLTAFALRDQVAVVDRGAVRFFDIKARGLAGAAGRLAAFDFTSVIEIDLTQPEGARLLRLPLEGVIAVAFDVTRELQLVAATEQALYVKRGGVLEKVWEAPAGAAIGGLAGSGRGVWVAIDRSLALLRESQLLHGSSSQAVVPEGGRLIGSPSGDVWVLGGPQLVRLGERAPGGGDEDRWRRSMLPIFQRVCRGCHLPSGSVSIDLSTYEQWRSRRNLIKQRLIDQTPTPMPPLSAGVLTYGELAAVKQWAESGK
jgi:hypothetical protein